MDQFLVPGNDTISQFLDPETDVMLVSDLDPETDIMDQFLDPETGIMGERTFMF